MVSFVHRHLAVMTFEITLLDAAAPVVVSSQLLNRQDGEDEYHVAAAALGDEGVATLFRIATAVNSRLLPVLAIADLSNPARHALVPDGNVRAGIYMDFEEVDPAALVEAVEKAGVRPEQCVLFVDFTGAPLGADFAPAIGELLACSRV